MIPALLLLVLAAAAPAPAPVNAELKRIYEEDQAGRNKTPPVIDPAADARRRRRVERLLAAGRARVSDDYYHAAMVFQHGGDTASYRRAHQLAVRAVELDPGNQRARWLVAASKDRELMSQDRPQLYGTQFNCAAGKCELYRVDPKVTDDERARWGVPPLAESRKQAEELSRRFRDAAPPGR